jgi:hypothetical protein
MTTTYKEEKSDDNGGEEESECATQGALCAPMLVLRREKERELPMWWYPSVCMNLEMGRWYKHTEEENVHRDLQHRTLTKYGGMERLLMAMTSSPENSSEDNACQQQHSSVSSSSSSTIEHQIHTKSDPLEVALDHLFPSSSTDHDNSKNNINHGGMHGSDQSQEKCRHQQYIDQQVRKTEEGSSSRSDVALQSKPVGNYNSK